MNDLLVEGELVVVFVVFVAEDDLAGGDVVEPKARGFKDALSQKAGFSVVYVK